MIMHWTDQRIIDTKGNATNNDTEENRMTLSSDIVLSEAAMKKLWKPVLVLVNQKQNREKTYLQEKLGR